MTKFKKLSDDEIKEVNGGNRTDIQKTTEETIPQIDDNVLITQTNNNLGKFTSEIFKTICTYDDGIDADGHKLYCCSDVNNRGLKQECASCPAKNSNC